MRSDATVCWNRDCRNLFAREKEHNRLYEKTCKYCGKIFNGRKKQFNCEECRKKRHNIYETIQQELRCYRCGQLIGYQERKIVKGITLPVASICLCNACRSNVNLKRAEAKTGERNPNWKGGVIIPRMTKVEMKAAFSKRMRERNPMKDPNIAANCHEKLRQLRKNGEIKVKTGRDHWLWRGNRNAMLVIRTRLKPWVRSVMQRDDFVCQSCGQKGGKLEVHHLLPFRNICADILNRFHIDSINSLDVNSEKFEQIVNVIIDAHDLSIGITYCKSCHAKYDNRRRIKK